MKTLRNMWVWIVFITAGLTLIGPVSGSLWAGAYQGTYRCRLTKKIVKLGDFASTVERYCGEPHNVVYRGDASHTDFGARATRRGRATTVRGSADTISTYVETWEYHYNRLPTRITISAGKVVRIEVGDD
jgi:hypothetical protein